MRKLSKYKRFVLANKEDLAIDDDFSYKGSYIVLWKPKIQDETLTYRQLHFVVSKHLHRYVKKFKKYPDNVIPLCKVSYDEEKTKLRFCKNEFRDIKYTEVFECEKQNKELN